MDALAYDWGGGGGGCFFVCVIPLLVHMHNSTCVIVKQSVTFCAIILFPLVRPINTTAPVSSMDAMSLQSSSLAQGTLPADDSTIGMHPTPLAPLSHIRPPPGHAPIAAADPQQVYHFSQLVPFSITSIGHDYVLCNYTSKLSAVRMRA